MLRVVSSYNIMFQERGLWQGRNIRWLLPLHRSGLLQVNFASSDFPLISSLCCSGAAALRTGADSVHIFCEATAAAVIRSYSSELVIHPVLDQEYGMEEVDAWLPRLDCVVIGPGLGRNQSMLGRSV